MWPPSWGSTPNFVHPWNETKNGDYHTVVFWVQQTRVKNNAGAKAFFSSTKNLWSASNDLISPTPRKLLVLWLCNCTRIFVQNWRRSSFSIFLPSTEVFWSSGYSDNEIPVSHWRLIVKSCILKLKTKSYLMLVYP